MIETWLPVANYEGLYEVSDYGRVRSLDRLARNTKSSCRMIKGQIITPYERENGYQTVKLAKARKKTNHYVHRLVAAAFHPNKKAEKEVLHRDGDKRNNISSNLSWGSRLDNMTDRTRLNEHANGERHGMAKLNEASVKAIFDDPRWHKFIAADYGVSTSLVGLIKSKRIWKHIHG